MAEKISRGAAEVVEQQQRAMGRPGVGGGPPPVKLLHWTYTIMMTAGAVGMIVVGSIYPAVSLWLLTRPGVREACSEGDRPEKTIPAASRSPRNMCIAPPWPSEMPAARPVSSAKITLGSMP